MGICVTKFHLVALQRRRAGMWMGGAMVGRVGSKTYGAGCAALPFLKSIACKWTGGGEDKVR